MSNKINKMVLEVIKELLADNEKDIGYIASQYLTNTSATPTQALLYALQNIVNRKLRAEKEENPYGK